MNEIYVNISRIWSLAHSLEVLMFVQGDKKQQVLLQVSDLNSTWYLTRPIFLNGGNDKRTEKVQLTVENLHPLTEYSLCPSIIDELGRVWDEGPCKKASTGTEADCTKVVTSAILAFVLVVLLVGIGFIGYRLFQKGFRKGFNLPSISITPKD